RVINSGRYGGFIACSGYPEGKNTQEIAAVVVNGNGGSGASHGAAGVAGGAGGSAAGAGAAGAGAAQGAAPVAAIPEDHGTCEKCGSKMVLRKGRFGPFIACSAYPACRNTKKLAMDQEG